LFSRGARRRGGGAAARRAAKNKRPSGGVRRTVSCDGDAYRSCVRRAIVIAA